MSNVNEVIFDMSFALGLRWPQIPMETKEKLMDELEGSRGLFNWVRYTAETFEAWWVALDEQDPRREDYYGEVDAQFVIALNALILRGNNHV